MKILSLKFSVNAQTVFGEQVLICGNIPELGEWNPSKALKLFTDSNLYPQWNSVMPIYVKKYTLIKFKLCVLDSNGNLKRWQQLPYNTNRKFNVCFNMQISFSENDLNLHVVSTDPIQTASNRKKTTDIINDLESESSSTKSFWKGFTENDQEDLSHYHNLASSMRKIMQLQHQQDFELHYSRTQHCPHNSLFIELAIKYEPQNYYLTIDQSLLLSQQIPSKSRKSTLDSQREKQFESNRKIEISSQQIASGINRIKEIIQSVLARKKQMIVLHINVNERNIKTVCNILNHKLYLKTILYIEENASKLSKILLQYNVSMIIIQQHQSFKLLLTQLSNTGYRIKHVKQSLAALQFKHYRRTLLYCKNQPHQNFVNHLSYESGDTQKISEYVLTSSHFPQEMALLKSIISQNQLTYRRFHRGKRIIFVTVDNIKNISQKILNLLIDVSGRKSNEVYILQHQLLTDINKVPSTLKDKIIILNSAGDMYISRQKSQNVYKILEISFNKIQQQYSKIYTFLQNQSHCKVQKSSQNTLLIEFTLPEMRQATQQSLFQLIQQINSKSINKLILFQRQDPNIVQVKPYFTSWIFYIKCILKGIIESQNPDKNLLLFIDYSSSQRILNYVEKIIKSHHYQSLIYQGFYCRSKDVVQINCIRPTLTQSSIELMLEQVLEQSQNSWFKDHCQIPHWQMTP